MKVLKNKCCLIVKVGHVDPRSQRTPFQAYFHRYHQFLLSNNTRLFAPNARLANLVKVNPGVGDFGYS